jgi:hypothetical protein
MGVESPRDALLDRLPLPYSIALRLRDAGVSDEVIAERVGVDLDVLPTFMCLAEAKLTAGAERDDPAD